MELIDGACVLILMNCISSLTFSFWPQRYFSQINCRWGLPLLLLLLLLFRFWAVYFFVLFVTRLFTCDKRYWEYFSLSRYVVCVRICERRMKEIKKPGAATFWSWIRCIFLLLLHCLSLRFTVSTIDSISGSRINQKEKISSQHFYYYSFLIGLHFRCSAKDILRNAHKRSQRPN